MVKGPILGLMAKAGQGPVLGPRASNTAPHRHSPAPSGAIRRPPTFSSAPPTPPAPTLSTHAPSVLSCMQAHLKLEHIPPALRIDIHHCTLLCAHAQTSYARRPAHLIDVPCRASQPPLGKPRRRRCSHHSVARHFGSQVATPAGPTPPPPPITYIRANSQGWLRDRY